MGSEPKAPLLEATDLRFAYTTANVLAGATLTVTECEALGVVGVNGAGKTTLLRVLCGLERPASGSVVFRGEDITNASPQERVHRGLVTVFGGRETVFGDLTVEENLMITGFTLWSRRSVLDERLREVYELFGPLADRRRSLAVQLSGGEQQMLGLAKAFLLRPPLLCIDELSLGLAPALVARLMETLRTFAATGGSSVLLVEQSAEVARGVAHRLVRLERGLIRDPVDRAEVTNGNAKASGDAPTRRRRAKAGPPARRSR